MQLAVLFIDTQAERIGKQSVEKQKAIRGTPAVEYCREGLPLLAGRALEAFVKMLPQARKTRGPTAMLTRGLLQSSQPAPPSAALQVPQTTGRSESG